FIDDRFEGKIDSETQYRQLARLAHQIARSKENRPLQEDIMGAFAYSQHNQEKNVVYNNNEAHITSTFKPQVTLLFSLLKKYRLETEKTGEHLPYIFTKEKTNSNLDLIFNINTYNYPTCLKPAM